MRTLILATILTVVALPSLSTHAQDRRGWQDSEQQNNENDGQNRDYQNRHHGNERSNNDEQQVPPYQSPHATNESQDRGQYTQYDEGQRRHRHRGMTAWRTYGQYDYNRVDQRYGDYAADRYYRDGRYYQERRLSPEDRVYRGSNDRYYCRRADGTTGLIFGLIGGGLLGDQIAPKGSRTLGAILGGASGALIGNAIGQGGVRCR